MIALIAGTGDLPGLLSARLVARGDPPVVCALRGHPPQVPGHLPRLDFRIETLGSLLAKLTLRGVTRICLAGAVRRPPVDPAAVDDATAPLIAPLVAAMGQGDDGALRAIIRLLEDHGFTVIGAAAIAPDLLPAAGIPTQARPGPDHEGMALKGQACIAAMGQADSGQACILRDGALAAQEGPEGTDAMIAGLPPGQGGILFKAPKPGQDLRADMPLIGPHTAMAAAEAGLTGIVIEAGGVMVLDLPQVVAILDGLGMFLWIRDRNRRDRP